MLRLKLFRLVKGLSQAKVAREASLITPDLSRIERGVQNPTDLQLLQLAVALGECIDAPRRLLDHVSADALVDGAEFRDAQTTK